ncbi:MAG TPA: amino acid transporter [Stenotrophomonas sp.]|nr:amino acid transporter [Stenotrophomonas sp.]
MNVDGGNIARCGVRTRAVLGTDHVVVLALALLVGGSVVALVGQHTAAQAGPAIVLSLLLAALGAWLVLYSLRDALRAQPDGSGLHDLLRAAWGQRVADLLLLALVLELTATVAGAAQSGARHLYAVAATMGVEPRQWLPVQVVATVLVLATAVMALLRLRRAVLLACALLTLKFGIGALLLVLAARHVHYAHWIPWLPSAVAPYRFGMGGVVAASVPLLAVFASTGLLLVLAPLVIRPRRQLVLAVGVAVPAGMLWLMVLAALQSGLVAFPALASTRPLSVALQGVTQLQWLLPLLPAAGAAGLAALQVVLLLLATTLCLQRWPGSGERHRVQRTAVIAWLGTGAALLAVWLPEGLLPSLPGPLALIALAAVCAGQVKQSGAARVRAPLATALCLLPLLQRLF